MAAATPEWPKTEPDFDTVLRFWIGRGQFMTGVTQRCIADGVWSTEIGIGHPLWERYLRAIGEMQHAFDMAIVLQELAKADPARAATAARDTWDAAQAGDSYGEWLWQWCEENGLDPQAIHDEGLADEPRAVRREVPSDG